MTTPPIPGQHVWVKAIVRRAPSEWPELWAFELQATAPGQTFMVPGDDLDWRPDETTVKRCGAPDTQGKACALPVGHNMGRVDLPESHDSAPKFFAVGVPAASPPRADAASERQHHTGCICVQCERDLGAENARLRQRVHEVADECQRRYGHLESELMKNRALLREARERHGEEMKAKGHEPYHHISGYGQATAALILAERDQARRERDAALVALGDAHATIHQLLNPSTSGFTITGTYRIEGALPEWERELLAEAQEPAQMPRSDA